MKALISTVNHLCKLKRDNKLILTFIVKDLLYYAGTKLKMPNEN